MRSSRRRRSRSSGSEHPAHRGRRKARSCGPFSLPHRDRNDAAPLHALADGGDPRASDHPPPGHAPEDLLDVAVRAGRITGDEVGGALLREQKADPAVSRPLEQPAELIGVHELAVVGSWRVAPDRGEPAHGQCSSRSRAIHSRRRGCRRPLAVLQASRPDCTHAMSASVLTQARLCLRRWSSTSTCVARAFLSSSSATSLCRLIATRSASALRIISSTTATAGGSAGVGSTSFASSVMGSGGSLAAAGDSSIAYEPGLSVPPAPTGRLRTPTSCRPLFSGSRFQTTGVATSSHPSRPRRSSSSPIDETARLVSRYQTSYSHFCTAFLGSSSKSRRR